ncbi:MAG: trypsin-like peptidase domain-containing protein [Acidobacteria bacterium]|nr:trypsin-like peptidase domain-containing protein [Acidobacteriota bacterium]
MHHTSTRGFIGVLALVGLMASGFSPAGSAVFATGQAPAVPQVPAGCPASVPELFNRVSPAVVSITAASIDPYDPEHRIDRVMGSGVIIDPSGLILTNSHVVFARQVITVTLDDGITLPARMVGADPVFDIALVRIPPPTKGVLPSVPFADSSQVAVGEEVFAIGNPLGLDQTLTRGIVSAVNRELPGTAWSLTEPLIQTDAAINPGNSGGPLVDACARIIGITTAVLPGAQGIGFAVPVDLVREVTPSLIEKGRVVRPWLGVQGMFVSPWMKEILRVPLVNGFLVEAVEPGSPAEQKGLRGGSLEMAFSGQPVLLGGDIVTRVNGAPIENPDALAKVLGTLTVGSALQIELSRDGKTVQVELVLSERPLLPYDMPWRRSGAMAGTAESGARPTSARNRTILF